MIELNIFIAFAAGLVSFFAPCVVPLLPTYVAYIFGVAFKNGNTVEVNNVVKASIFYILGFSLIFVILGTFAGSVGGLLRSFDIWFLRIGGIILILFGLETLGVFHVNIPQLGRVPSFPSFVQHAVVLRSFFLGVVFSLAWTPCVGAILGSILLFAASTQTASSGAILLFAYSLGISLPFLLISFLLLHSKAALIRLKKITPFVSRFAGVILVLMGILLLTDTFKFVNAWIFDIAYSLGYQIR